jgi:hypothetical protein
VNFGGFDGQFFKPTISSCYPFPQLEAILHGAVAPRVSGLFDFVN